MKCKYCNEKIVPENDVRVINATKKFLVIRHCPYCYMAHEKQEIK